MSGNVGLCASSVDFRKTRLLKREFSQCSNPLEEEQGREQAQLRERSLLTVYLRNSSRGVGKREQLTLFDVMTHGIEA